MSAAAILRLRRPDDWHVHLRDGEMLRAVLPWTARCFARAIVMPNLQPPVTTAAQADAYRDRILEAGPQGRFTPLMTCYLTDDTDPEALAAGFARGSFVAAKLYPANATTNSAAGVTDIGRLEPVFERMARIDMPLLVHGEVTDAEIDIFDREQVFLDRIILPLRRRLPELRIVFEHVTTAEVADYVMSAEPGIAATVTPHHLVLNRNDLFRGGLRPHAYCLPVAKREHHRQALRRAVASSSDRFFLGTDSAPHPISDKLADCGCAGIFCAPAAIEIYATIFEEMGALDRLEAFASLNGPGFYRLPVNDEWIGLERRPLEIPEIVETARGGLRPFRGGSRLPWRLVDDDADAAAVAQ